MGLFDLAALERSLQRGAFHLILDHPDMLAPPLLRDLAATENCTIYPPIGYRTAEAQRARVESFIANVEAFLQGHPLNLVEGSVQTLLRASPAGAND
jgi:phosphoglycerate dehydrogenase-like enzyme